MSTKVTDISKSPAMRRKIVDEAGRLAAWYKRNKSKFDRFGVVKKIIASWGDDPEQSYSYTGKSYTAQVSAQDFARQIENMQGVYDKLGHDKFIEHCTLAFKVLDIFIEPEEAIKAGLVKKERTGARTVTIQPREPKAEAA